MLFFGPKCETLNKKKRTIPFNKIEKRILLKKEKTQKWKRAFYIEYREMILRNEISIYNKDILLIIMKRETNTHYKLI